MFILKVILSAFHVNHLLRRKCFFKWRRRELCLFCSCLNESAPGIVRVEYVHCPLRDESLQFGSGATQLKNKWIIGSNFTGFQAIYIKACTYSRRSVERETIYNRIILHVTTRHFEPLPQRISGVGDLRKKWFMYASKTCRWNKSIPWIIIIRIELSLTHRMHPHHYEWSAF